MAQDRLLINVFEVGRAAESELIGIALRFELVFRERLRWHSDARQCIDVLNRLAIGEHKELRQRTQRFMEALSEDELQKLRNMGLRVAFFRPAASHSEAPRQSRKVYRGQQCT